MSNEIINSIQFIHLPLDGRRTSFSFDRFRHASFYRITAQAFVSAENSTSSQLFEVYSNLFNNENRPIALCNGNNSLNSKFVYDAPQNGYFKFDREFYAEVVNNGPSHVGEIVLVLELGKKRD